MESKKLWVMRMLILTCGLLLLPTRTLAQEVVARETLDEWFWSRFSFGIIIGAIVGLIIGLVQLCRLPFASVGPLNINSQARRKLFTWAAIIFFAGALLLFLDAWLLYPFSDVSLGFLEALTQVWLNYRMLLIMVVTVLVFILVAALATRLKSDCHCRYAFIRGPRGK